MVEEPPPPLLDVETRLGAILVTTVGTARRMLICISVRLKEQATSLFVGGRYRARVSKISKNYSHIRKCLELEPSIGSGSSPLVSVLILAMMQIRSSRIVIESGSFAELVIKIYRRCKLESERVFEPRVPRYLKTTTNRYNHFPIRRNLRLKVGSDLWRGVADSEAINCSSW